MELRLPLEVFPGRQATCRAVFGTWGSFPDDARASHCPFVVTSLTGWSSERCPGIGFLSRGDREIGVLRNVEAPTHIRWPKYWGFSFISPFNEYSGLISFRIDWFDLLAVQGTLKSFLQHHSSKPSILRCSDLFVVLFMVLFMVFYP